MLPEHFHTITSSLCVVSACSLFWYHSHPRHARSRGHVLIHQRRPASRQAYQRSCHTSPTQPLIDIPAFDILLDVTYCLGYKSLWIVIFMMCNVTVHTVYTALNMQCGRLHNDYRLLLYCRCTVLRLKWCTMTTEGYYTHTDPYTWSQNPAETKVSSRDWLTAFWCGDVWGLFKC